MPEMTPVTSKAMKAIGFDPETQELHIDWKSGSSSVHPNWTPEKHEALVNAPSKGGHFHKHVRKQHPGKAK